MDFRIGRPGSNELCRDVLAGDARCRPFFPADWRRVEAYETRAKALREEERSTRWAEALSTPGEASTARLQAVKEGKGFVVTTGQQPGLFSGPLYSIWKALSAIRLADALQEALDVPVLPVFWVASEDHDWDETDHTWLIGVDNDLHRVALDPVEGAGDAPLFRLPIGAGIPALLEAVQGMLPETDVAGETLDRLRAAYSGDDVTLASGFQTFLEGLLEPMGMAFVQAHDPVLKELSKPVLREGIHRADDIEARMRKRAGELEEAGYPVQVPILEGGVNLFLEADGHRERLYREGDGFVMRHSGTTFALDELDRIVEEEPGRLSPNVHLRPLVEAAVFPTLAYVAGPGELTYYGQLSPMYEALDVGMPVIYPRHGVTLYESKIAKVLDKHGVETEALARPFHEIAQDFARDEVPDGVRTALGKIRGAIGQGTSELQEAAVEVDPTLKGPIGSARGAAFAAFADAEKAILKAVKRESETTLAQLEKARLHLFPEGKPQERMLNVVYYTARYGVRFLQEVKDAMDPGLQPSDTQG